MSGSRQRSLVWAAALVCLAAGPARADMPVVAVDQIQVQGMDLSPRSREVLAHFLAVRLAASSLYRIIPRGQVKQSLARLKRREAATCEDRDCLMELGEELAASKMIQARIISIADRCSLSLTQYDVRSATAELASSIDGACTEPDLATSVDRAVAALVSKARQAAATTRGDKESTSRQVSVYFSSSPTSAAVEIDGAVKGRTPLRLDLDAGRGYALTLRANWPYAPFRKSFEARDWQRIHAKLHLEHVDPRELATTTEWFSIGLGSGFFANDIDPLFALSFRVATLRFPYLFVSIVDMTMGLTSKEIQQDGEQTKSLRGLLSIGSRPGLYLSLGSTGRHQMMLGIGLHYSAYDNKDSTSGASLDGSMFSISPGLEYVYLASNGSASLGGEIRGVLPVTGQFHGAVPPYQVLFSLRLGLSLSPMIRAHQRKMATTSRAPPE